jgi:hypothetical protein
MCDLNRIRLLLDNPLMTQGELELFERHGDRRRNRVPVKVAESKVNADAESGFDFYRKLKKISLIAT